MTTTGQCGMARSQEPPMRYGSAISEARRYYARFAHGTNLSEPRSLAERPGPALTVRDGRDRAG